MVAQHIQDNVFMSVQEVLCVNELVLLKSSLYAAQAEHNIGDCWYSEASQINSISIINSHRSV